MPTRYAFDCHVSVHGGWVASGTVNGEAGGSFEQRPVWYGCQGETWPELQAGMAALVAALKPRVALRPVATPIEAFVKPWPERQPMLVPPFGDGEQLFWNLINVGTRRRAWTEHVEAVSIISFLKVGALAIHKPEGAWKPELVSSFLGFAIGLVPEHPTPVPERAGQTSADLVEEILLGGQD